VQWFTRTATATRQRWRWCWWQYQLNAQHVAKMSFRNKRLRLRSSITDRLSLVSIQFCLVLNLHLAVNILTSRSFFSLFCTSSQLVLQCRHQHVSAYVQGFFLSFKLVLNASHKWLISLNTWHVFEAVNHLFKWQMSAIKVRLLATGSRLTWSLSAATILLPVWEPCNSSCTTHQSTNEHHILSDIKSHSDIHNEVK